ncbi:MAG: hypothetical protein KDI36_12725, partial [Pseudomonadales bacterium]|nr:hypothetical protein [Pseudomonadales bacterium]
LIDDNFSASFSLGLLDTEFDQFINEFGEDLSGRDQSQAPSYTWQLGLSYERDGWNAGLSADGRDAFYFSDRHDVKSTRYTLLNASLGYRQDSWEISLWGRNLGDTDYTIRGFGSFGNDPRKGYVTEPYVQFGEPAVYGITLTLSYQ